MKSEYKRDISQEYFRPLKSFNYRSDFHPSVANNKQIELTNKLSNEYGIPEGNLLRLIMYADIAWSYATESEMQVYYSDMTEIAEFEKVPEPIKEIFFRGNNKSILISNPYLIDKLYNSMLDFMDFQKILKEKKTDTKKKRPSAKIVKLIATELFNELKQVEKITEWKSYCIIGYIFCLYKIGIKKEDPIMTEEKFNYLKNEKQVVTETYLQYLAHRIKRYINN